jgi:hypothetical protein
MQAVCRALERDQRFVLQAAERLGLLDLGLNPFSHVSKYSRCDEYWQASYLKA